jgi:quercetin dioxygenase-like cupin family protein
LQAALDTYTLCGVKGKRYLSSAKEMEDLTALQRGVFSKCSLIAGEDLRSNEIYLAFPCKPGQLLASHLSKYNSIKMIRSVSEPDLPIMLPDVEIMDDTEVIQGIIANVLDLIRKSGVVIPVDSTCDISHHFGLGEFESVGVTIINCINREYCKKILVVLPGQRNPEHMHRLKEETFTVLYGELVITCGGEKQIIRKGESKTVERGVPHEFLSETGCVFEEISTTHNINDSFYGDESTKFVCPRKTEIYITRAILES